MDHLTHRGNNDKEPLPLYVEHTNSTQQGNLTAKKNGKLRMVRSIRLRQIAFYLMLWVCVLTFHERLHAKSVLKSCHWGSHHADAHHISLIADPQLVDDYSYPGRPKLINYFAKKFSDNYLHRNYLLHKNILKPDSIFFLGDLFDGGREWGDRVWYDEYRRFNKVFPRFPDTRTVMSLPGNHDIGFGNDVNITMLNRFRTFFGESNTYYILGGHAIVMLDTISLSSQDPLVNSEPQQFLMNISQPTHEVKKYPVVLLTHVPLYRFPDKQDCGPLRESKKLFPVMKGKQYQTVLEYKLSQDILQAVQPVLVISGDDHDYCEVSHSYINGGENKVAKELTIKSVALSAGIKYPAMQLLSLDESTATYETSICYLPKPSNSLQTYLFIILAQIFSFVLIFVSPHRARRVETLWRHFSASDKKELPLSIEDEKRDRRTEFTDSLKGVVRLGDWGIPESRNWAACILNVGILVVSIWFVILWFFETV